MDNYEAIPRFSDILNQTLQWEVKANHRLFDGLNGKVNLSIRDIQRYRTGEQVPGYMNAKAILDYLQIETDEEYLKRVLKVSKDKAKEIRTSRKGSRRSVLINSSSIDLGIGLDLTDLNSILQERMTELYGEKATLSRYINDLIADDLINHNLTIKGEIENG